MEGDVGALVASVNSLTQSLNINSKVAPFVA